LAKLLDTPGKSSLFQGQTCSYEKLFAMDSKLHMELFSNNLRQHTLQCVLVSFSNGSCSSKLRRSALNLPHYWGVVVKCQSEVCITTLITLWFCSHPLTTSHFLS